MPDKGPVGNILHQLVGGLRGAPTYRRGMEALRVALLGVQRPNSVFAEGENGDAGAARYRKNQGAAAALRECEPSPTLRR